MTSTRTKIAIASIVFLGAGYLVYQSFRKRDKSENPRNVLKVGSIFNLENFLKSLYSVDKNKDVDIFIENDLNYDHKDLQKAILELLKFRQEHHNVKFVAHIEKDVSAIPFLFSLVSDYSLINSTVHIHKIDGYYPYKILNIIFDGQKQHNEIVKIATFIIRTVGKYKKWTMADITAITDEFINRNYTHIVDFRQNLSPYQYKIKSPIIKSQL